MSDRPNLDGGELVRDVLASRGSDRVLVVHRGPPQRTAWIEALRNAGFDIQPNRRSTHHTSDRPTEE